MNPVRNFYRFLIAIFMLSGMAFAEGEKTRDPMQLFYQGNMLYEAKDYSKACESYLAALDCGVESANLYYNIGNVLLKLGKPGYAIIAYERAKRLAPGDSDLKANLEYAKSITGDPTYEIPPEFFLTRFIKLPFRSFDLNLIAIIAMIFYLVAAALVAVSLVNRFLFRRYLKFLTIIAFLIFLYSLLVFCLRFYDEEMLKHGIIVAKSVECKYEPIEKSTTYYTLHEGNPVILLRNRNGWRQVERLDGKRSWVKKEAVEPL